MVSLPPGVVGHGRDGMTFSIVQLLGGLSYATTLFLMAAGLTLIFGVTRIVNFAHGSFFMLGALFTAHWVTNPPKLSQSVLHQQCF